MGDILFQRQMLQQPLSHVSQIQKRQAVRHHGVVRSQKYLNALSVLGVNVRLIQIPHTVSIVGMPLNFFDISLSIAKKGSTWSKCSPFIFAKSLAS